MITAAAAAAAMVVLCAGTADAATGWAIQATPNPAGGGNSYLAGVSCVSPTSCIAVGYHNPLTGPTVTLAEYWNGSTWAIQATPNPTGASSSYLEGISCVSASSCTAVGYDSGSKGYGEFPLAERWNGSTWTIQAMKVVDQDKHTYLYGVSCHTATSCTAVGSYYAPSAEETFALAEHWNGSGWAVQTDPAPVNSGLTGVSCRTATSCTAVGYNGTTGGTLAEASNGGTWTVQTTPSPGSDGDVLTGVSCRTATSCIAAGYSTDSSGVGSTLAEQWNGSTWTVQATPNPAGVAEIELNGISCASAASCSAAGWYMSPSTGHDVPLAEHWNGSTWVVQATPDPAGAVDTFLEGISCATPSCTAVGVSQNSLGRGKTLAEAR